MIPQDPPPSLRQRKIKLIRERLNLTQRDVAQKIGVTPGSVSLIENGRRAATDRFALQLCAAYGVNPNWLLDDSDFSEEAPFNAVANVGDQERDRRLSDEETTFWRRYLQLSQEDRDLVDAIIDLIAQKSERKTSRSADDAK